jgi:hypothetical protein
MKTPLDSTKTRALERNLSLRAPPTPLSPTPCIEAGGIGRPARIYDLRATFASNALAAGIGAFELAKVMGTSIEMIERHYGTLLDGAGAGIAARLTAFQAEPDQAIAAKHPS